MVASINPGITFQAGQSYTATQFNSLLGNATISGVDRTNMASTSRPVTVAATTPSSPQTGELWYDTSTALLKLYDGTNWQAVGPRNTRTFTAQSSITSGDVVMVDADNASSVETTTTESFGPVAGVAVENGTSGNPVQIQVSGVVSSLNCTSEAVSIGSYLVQSATAGLAWTETASIANELKGNAFAIALSSKAGGSPGAVAALLLGPVDSTYHNIRTYSTYSITAASLSLDTWYDIPDAALGASVTTNGDSAMDVPFRTIRPYQLVTLAIKDLLFTSNAAANIIKGYRVLLDGTSVGGGVSKDALLLPGSSGQEESVGAGAVIYQLASTYVLSVKAATIEFAVPTAGTHTVRLQFLAGTAASYTASGSSTASLLAHVH